MWLDIVALELQFNMKQLGEKEMQKQKETNSIKSLQGSTTLRSDHMQNGSISESRMTRMVHVA